MNVHHLGSIVETYSCLGLAYVTSPLLTPLALSRCKDSLSGVLIVESSFILEFLFPDPALEIC